MNVTSRELQLSVTPTDLDKVAKLVQRCAGAVFGISIEATPRIIFDYKAPDKPDRFQVVLTDTFGMKSPTAVVINPNRLARNTRARLDGPKGSRLLELHSEFGHEKWEALHNEMLYSASVAATCAVVQAFYNDKDGNAAIADDGLIEAAEAIMEILTGP